MYSELLSARAAILSLNTVIELILKAMMRNKTRQIVHANQDWIASQNNKQPIHPVKRKPEARSPHAESIAKSE